MVKHSCNSNILSELKKSCLKKFKEEETMCIPHAGTPVDSAFNRRIEIRRRKLYLPQEELHDLQTNLRRISHRRKPNLMAKELYLQCRKEKSLCWSRSDNYTKETQIKNGTFLGSGNNQIHKNSIKQEDFNSKKKGQESKPYPPNHLVTPSLNTTRLGLQCQTPTLGL